MVFYNVDKEKKEKIQYFGLNSMHRLEESEKEKKKECYSDSRKNKWLYFTYSLRTL